MKKFGILALIVLLTPMFIHAASPKGIISSGIPLYDNNNDIVNAHGASIIEDGGRYYMFGEWKSDTTNAFPGFSCYSSDDLAHWKFEGVALPRQPDGILGPERVGERVKVMKCPSTGEYVMFMHADNLQYKDPCTAYATSSTITGPYTLHGPLLFEGKPLRHWDMGAFQDGDGSGYILIHHGPIYKLADDYKSVVAKVAHVDGGGESPAVFKKNGRYYHLSSNLTSWERNDNFYYTAPSIEGPWERKGLFCPEGSLTWNSQTTFVFPLIVEGDTIPMYMGDRWSYPHQASAATYVWQPINVKGDTISIVRYMQFWDVATGRDADVLAAAKAVDVPAFRSNVAGEKFELPFKGSHVALVGEASRSGGYGRVSIIDVKGDTAYTSLVDFYALKPSRDVRIVTPPLPVAEYTVVVEVTGEHPVWYNKRRDVFGSDDDWVDIDKAYIFDCN